jgi:dihydroxyacetone kinase-like protein
MAKEYFAEKDGQIIVENMIKIIQDNVEYLSEVDGAIGDGDHGINMNKGFTMCSKVLSEKGAVGLREALVTLSSILMTEIGGSMGPLYGSLFRGMAKPMKGIVNIDKIVFSEVLRNGLNKVKTIGNAQVGDKTIVDTLEPSVDALEKAVVEDKSFSECLVLLDKAAKEGQESTVDLVAKLGRAARLGERSRGVLDAGATSCYLLLHTICQSIDSLL